MTAREDWLAVRGPNEAILGDIVSADTTLGQGSATIAQYLETHPVVPVDAEDGSAMPAARPWGDPAWDSFGVIDRPGPPRVPGAPTAREEWLAARGESPVL